MFGGWKHEYSKEQIEAEMTTAFAAHAHLAEKIYAPGKLVSVYKVLCKTNSGMWSCLKAMKGTQLTTTEGSVQIELWHSIDKSEDERKRAKKKCLHL